MLSVPAQEPGRLVGQIAPRTAAAGDCLGRRGAAAAVVVEAGHSRQCRSYVSYLIHYPYGTDDAFRLQPLTVTPTPDSAGITDRALLSLSLEGGGRGG
jgi:hypothetical protein